MHDVNVYRHSRRCDNTNTHTTYKSQSKYTAVVVKTARSNIAYTNPKYTVYSAQTTVQEIPVTCLVV